MTTPSLKPSSATQLPEGTNCVACSEDGRYLSVGHSQGFSVWCASSLVCVAEWLQDQVEITSTQMTRMAETTYLLGTVDDMGVARLFACHCEAIYLLSAINIMENIDKRSICLTFEISEGARYGAASMSCSGAVWLEIYHLPSEAWLKELALTTKLERNTSVDANIKFSPVKVVKILPPKVLSVTSCCRQSGKPASSADEKETVRRCTHHFLLPCGQFPADSRARSHPGLPFAVCMWWSGSHDLFQYFLQKNEEDLKKRGKDVETTPDVLWPNAKAILCSAVSRCTRYVALGLDDDLVCVWDRRTGAPLAVEWVSAADSAFSRMQFLDNQPVPADGSRSFVRLLIQCKSGAIYTITTERGTESCMKQLTERPKHSGDHPSVAVAVQFLQDLSLVVQRSGKMFLQDVTSKATVCFLTTPQAHPISTPCNPVYALSSHQQTLFIKGDQDPRASSKRRDRSQLFSFCFRETDFMKQYVVSPPDSPQQQKALDSVCALSLQQRAQSVHERNKAAAQSWKRLEETAAELQQRSKKAAAT
ncbi:uncharacterized protein V6R79_003797 [Siganus canaliculatus]